MIFEEQTHQQDCIKSILTGLKNIDFESANSQQLIKNLKEQSISSQSSRFPIVPRKRLDVLMETGTGKTFTYLQMIYEINHAYNKTKFLIILPRTAIKLGTVQNIRLTSIYFYQKYGKYLNVVVYPEDGIESIENRFIRGTGIDVLITTNGAFNSESNVINKTVEYSYMEPTIWLAIAKLSPIVIIDEPHLLKGVHTKRGIAKLTSSTIVRFGATYPNQTEDQLSNVVYVLDSISAFNRHMVKRVAVSTVIDSQDSKSDRIYAIKRRNSFRVDYVSHGLICSSVLREGDDIGAKTNRNSLNGVSVVRINKDNVRLSDGSSWKNGSSEYQLEDEEIEMLMRIAIEKHFEREEFLFNRRIKALSLFFIPGISDFRGRNPRIRLMFERLYPEIRNNILKSTTNSVYKDYLAKDFDKDGVLSVHEGYFSGDSGTLDEREGRGVDLILRDKERLLSFTTPLRFIFSVWALQEGWDNPNIFTLCKLKSTGSEISRRQQVGRGLRLAIDVSGQRQTIEEFDGDTEEFFRINTLTVIVSGKEKEFISRIQEEIKQASFGYVGEKITLDDLRENDLSDTEAATIWLVLTTHGVVGSDGEIILPLGEWINSNRHHFRTIDSSRLDRILDIIDSAGTNPVIVDEITDAIVQVRRGRWEQFRPLWTSINRRVRMKVATLDYEKVVGVVRDTFEARAFTKPEQTLETSHYDTFMDRIIRDSVKRIGGKEILDTNRLVDIFTVRLADKMQLPVPFMVKLTNEIGITKMSSNIAAALMALETDIINAIYLLSIDSVEYSFENETSLPNELQDKDGNLIEQISRTRLGRFVSTTEPPGHYLFDKAVYDSMIELESIFKDPSLLDHNRIDAFAKLPRIRIPTPKGSYSPDFGYFVSRKDSKPLVLVIETKGYDDESAIPADEQLKIRYAQAFFKALKRELPRFDVMFKTRVNSQSLRSLIEEPI